MASTGQRIFSRRDPGSERGKTVEREYQYEVAFSFAGEQRGYVEKVADCLRARGVAIFYDYYEEAELWGKNLYEHLTKVYRNKARYTIMFISEDYAKKNWTTHERRAAQARAFEENSEYILPARFDETEIEGVLSTVGYIGLKDRSPEAFSEIVVKKLISSGLTVPSQQLRKNLYETDVINNLEPTKLAVKVTSTQDIAIQGATVIAVADNGTWLSSETDIAGKATFEIKTRRLYSILVAHEFFPAAYKEDIDPGQDIEFKIAMSANIGSTTIISTGFIPGIEGMINPIFDNIQRLYLYADNISLDEGKAQPATFEINKPITIEDAHGRIAEIVFKFVKGKIFLLQFTRAN